MQENNINLNKEECRCCGAAENIKHEDYCAVLTTQRILKILKKADTN